MTIDTNYINSKTLAVFVFVGLAVRALAGPHAKTAAACTSIAIVLLALAISEYYLTRGYLRHHVPPTLLQHSLALPPMYIWQLTWQRLLDNPMILGMEALVVGFTA